MFDQMKEQIGQDQEVKKYLDAHNQLSKVLTKNLSNPIKGYHFYKSVVDIDLNEMAESAKTESRYVNQLFGGLALQSPVKIDMGIKAVLDAYRRFAELIKPLVNTTRIMIQMHDGVSDPKPHLTYVQNVKIISSHNEYSFLVEFIDPHIRNSESHLTTEIKKKEKKILIVDRRKKPKIIIREYTPEELWANLEKLKQVVFLSYFASFVLIDGAFKGVLLQSPEYRMALLSIGNT